MPTDPSVIKAISSAVDSDSENLGLRLHLISLLLDAGDAASALEHCGVVLAREPDSVDGLSLAVKAAEALGQADKAARYARLLAAIGPQPQQEPPSQNTHAPLNHEATINPEAPIDHETPIKHEAPIKKVALHLVASDGEQIALESEDPGITLADVAGMEEVKRRLNLAFLAPMRNPDMMKLYGKSLTGGLMLYGPPGCGKTFIARAIAGELGAKFVSVGLSDVLDMWLGNSERNLHEIFETARRESPSVLFFDEIDALGRKRSLVRHSAQNNVVNVMLSEMDGVNRTNKGLFILAATNHPWDVDSALRRPGRFDRTILVLPPDKPARLAMLEYYLKDRPVSGIDVKSLADRTEDYSGADIAHLCSSAAELALEESLETGNAFPISSAHIKKAMTEVRPSTRTWFEMARNYAMFANEGGVYDDLLRYMRSRKLI
jgi:SpoVK/Ycf46/Vps4 family AAA+-type ATPase